MRRNSKFIIVASFILFFNNIAKLQNINLYDQLKRKDGLWTETPDSIYKIPFFEGKIFNEVGKFHLCLYDSLDKRPVSVVLNYVNGKKEGVAYYIVADSILLARAFFRDDKLHGVLTLYDRLGNIVRISNFNNGLLDGVTQIRFFDFHRTDYNYQNGVQLSFCGYEFESKFEYLLSIKKPNEPLFTPFFSFYQSVTNPVDLSNGYNLYGFIYFIVKYNKREKCFVRYMYSSSFGKYVLFND